MSMAKEVQNGQQRAGGERKPPAHEIRLGRLRATIWANTTDDGTWYSVTVSRVYQDGGGKTKSASSFGRDDLLPAAEVLRLAYHWVAATSPDAHLTVENATG
jgi:hypothetical protein